MYPLSFSTSFIALVFCYFGAAEPPPSHGYGPPAPVEFNSNEVSAEQYNAPLDFGGYGSFTQGSPSSYNAPTSSHYKASSNFAPHYSGANTGGFPSFKGAGGKGGVSSSYISIVHGPGGAASPSKNRPITYHGVGKNQGPSGSYSGASFAPASYSSPAGYSEGNKFAPNAYSSGELAGFGSATSFGKAFGAAPTPSYNSAGSSFEFPTPNSAYKNPYESGSSDEVASYSNDGPSYATFSGSKPSFNPSTFSHGGRGGSGNAYSTANVNVGGRATGQQNFHPSAFTGSFKPSAAKTYNRYSSSSGPSYQTAHSPTSFGGNPLVGSETGYNSRALKGGYNAAENHEEYSGEDTANANNFFGGNFGDGAGIKVQSSYSTG